MELGAIQIINGDVLVIGGGAAGLRAAIEARQYGLSVVLISESPVGFRNNTAISGATLASSGIWKETGDSPEIHLRDTIASGRFMNDRRLVEIITRGATRQIGDLIKFGVTFRRRRGELLVWRIPGHTYARSISAERFKGVNISKPMRQYAASIDVKLIDGILVTKLLLTEDAVVGALGIDGKGQVLAVNAKSTVLATGGAGQLYFRTNNAVGLTGDGYALAYEAGATIRDMEFVQFYPTNSKYGRKICPYENLIPNGAILRNSLGENILERHGIADFVSMTRDKLTRTIMTEIIDGRGIEGHVVFDLSTMPREEAREFQHGGYEEKIPVTPAVHFFMGGLRINESAEPGIDGLYAAGEVCGGIHGANRLGSNAITETLVFGAIAGGKAAVRASRMGLIQVRHGEVTAEVERLNDLASGTGRGSIDEVQQSLKQTMWDKVGIIRSKQSLEYAQREILALRDQSRALSVTNYEQLWQLIKLTNMLTVSEMVCKAALIRTESRGAHYRTDYTEEDNERWLKIVEISRQRGQMTLLVTPVDGEVQNNESA